MTNLVRIAGVVVDLDQVPDKDEPAESHVRYTGEAYVHGPEGEIVRYARMHAGPVPAEEQT